MITLVTLKHRRLQYSDEREDYHNHMDTSRLIEEEAQYNAWTSISPFSSLFRSTLSITVIIFVWQLYHSLWISDIPCGWSLMMINVLAVLTKSVCTNRRLHKKSHLTRHVVLLKDAICNLSKFLHICQFWEPIEWDCASKTLLASPPFSIQKLNILIKETLQLCEVSYKKRLLQWTMPKRRWNRYLLNLETFQFARLSERRRRFNPEMRRGGDWEPPLTLDHL